MIHDVSALAAKFLRDLGLPDDFLESLPPVAEWVRPQFVESSVILGAPLELDALESDGQAPDVVEFMQLDPDGGVTLCVWDGYGFRPATPEDGFFGRISPVGRGIEFDDAPFGLPTEDLGLDQMLAQHVRAYQY